MRYLINCFVLSFLIMISAALPGCHSAKQSESLSLSESVTYNSQDSTSIKKSAEMATASTVLSISVDSIELDLSSFLTNQRNKDSPVKPKAKLYGVNIEETKLIEELRLEEDIRNVHSTDSVANSSSVSKQVKKCTARPKFMVIALLTLALLVIYKFKYRD